MALSRSQSVAFGEGVVFAQPIDVLKTRVFRGTTPFRCRLDRRSTLW
ncbi:MAG TPA: hypothetical protein VHM69_06905 [Rubrobacter sp.]|nr:hypothetical protein [Rubrobacter sp.]